MSDLLRITERFRLDKLIHASDTASVFRATDLRSGGTVALKLIRGDLDESRHDLRPRFESAASAWSECRHASLPRLLDHGFTAAGSAFLVTEYLVGAGFELFTGSSAARVLPLLLPILDGLEELDRHQLAHRNLRPDNLLLVTDDDEERLLLLGWGRAVAGTGERGRRADLRDFAEVTCAAIGAEIERDPAPSVTLPATAAGDPIADAPEMAMLLSLLLQPGTTAPATLYAELRRAFRQALHGDAGPSPQGAGRRADGRREALAAAAGPAAAEAARAGQAARVVDLDQTRAVAADATIEVPRDRLLGALDRLSAAGTNAASTAGTVADTTAAGTNADMSAGTTAGTTTGAGDATAPLPAQDQVRGDTLPLFRPEDLAPTAPEATPDAARAETPLSANGAPGGLIAPPMPAATTSRRLPRPGHLHRPPALPLALAGAAALTVMAVLAFWRQPAGRWHRPPDEGRTAPASAAIAARAAIPTGTGSATGSGNPVSAGSSARAGTEGTGSAGGGQRAPTAALAPAAPTLPAAPAATPPPSASVPPALPGAAAAPGAPPILDPHLQAVASLLAAGDAAGARRELAQISAPQLAALAPADHAAYDRLTAALAADRRRQIAADLAAAIRRGDIRRINAALTAARWEPDLPAAVRRDLERARQAVDLDARLARSDLAQAPQDALRDATALLAILPRHLRAGELREQAAKAIEDQADAAIASGDAERATGLLAGLRQQWPDRPGVKDRFERVEAQRRGDAQLDAALAAASRAEAAGQPLQGLEALAAANPGTRYRERFRRQRERLEALLARLDAAPPAISLAPGFKLEYEKGARIAVPLRITDDLAVKSAECWVRPEGAADFQPLPVRHLSGADYEVVIPPELHQNRALDLYAAATDNSGHRTLLGSRDQPLKLKRRTWIEKIFSGKPEGSGRSGSD